MSKGGIEQRSKAFQCILQAVHTYQGSDNPSGHYGRRGWTISVRVCGYSSKSQSKLPSSWRLRAFAGSVTFATEQTSHSAGRCVLGRPEQRQSRNAVWWTDWPILPYSLPRFFQRRDTSLLLAHAFPANEGKEETREENIRVDCQRGGDGRGCIWSRAATGADRSPR